MAWWLDRTGSGGGDEDRRWARFGGCALGHELTVCDPLGQLVDAVVSTRAHTKHKRTPRWRPFVFLASSTSNCTPAKAGYSEPQIGIEPMTARLRIGCSTTELLWRCFTCDVPREKHALERTRTATPCGTAPSRRRVYQFHHQSEGPGQLAGTPLLRPAVLSSCEPVLRTTGATGLEPATSRVTVECSNQTELRPQSNHLEAFQLKADPARMRRTSSYTNTCSTSAPTIGSP